MIWVDTLTGNGVFVMVSGDEYAKQIDAELDSLRATARAVQEDFEQRTRVVDKFMNLPWWRRLFARRPDLSIDSRVSVWLNLKARVEWLERLRKTIDPGKTYIVPVSVSQVSAAPANLGDPVLIY